MCGIFGMVGNIKNIDKSKIPLMLGSLLARGPDEKGVAEFESCILGQTRLSVIDLLSGHQPMTDSENNLTITFNGEIYNFKELRETLYKLGHTFKTNSDTEVILKAYAEYGEDCPIRLDGMFAFAIWDEKNKTLFMARDRFGKKPFYYCTDRHNNFIFASEIKAIFESGTIKGIIDPKAIDNYLALMYIPPQKTIYKNIHTLAPAEYATYKNGTLLKKKYWKLRLKPKQTSYDEARNEIKKLFDKAVKKRLIADVEIGSFLSGGVDSTLVTAYAEKHLDRPIKTFSLEYANHMSELPFAKEAALKIRADHKELRVGNNLIESLKESIEYFDEPHADSSDFPQALISDFAGKYVKVALSGDGADELFMGYGWYQKHLHLSLRKHTVAKLFLNPFEGYIKNISIFDKNERKKLWGKNSKNVNDFVSPELLKSKIDPITKINIFDLTTYLPGQLLSKIDRMGMMHSLEVRSPFLDSNLAEFVFNLPTEFKMNKNENKIILKDILSEIMPKEFVYRRKQGFGAPVNEWLKDKDVKRLIEEKLTDGAMIHEYLDKKVTKQILEKFYKNNDDSYHYKAWLLLCLELWFLSHKQYHAQYS